MMNITPAAISLMLRAFRYAAICHYAAIAADVLPL